MFNLPGAFYDLNIFSIMLRLSLALIMGGVIGLERGANRHPAGFRTHILVCVGAALAMLTNQYICETFASASDPARLGAQVISGVGFLGVGTILITGRNRIRGLTTAAGLWASACLGLAVGIGFYEGAIVGAILIFVSLSLLPSIEKYVYEHSDVVNLYVEVKNLEYAKLFLNEIKAMKVNIYETNLNQPNPMTPGGVALTVSLKLPKHANSEKLIMELCNIEGVTIINKI